MNNKKHIDRIFQEKLKDFEVAPSPKAWKNIQSKLEQPKKQKRKSAVIWLQLTGVAALLLLLFTIGNTITNNNKDVNNTKFVETENPENNTKTNNQKVNTNNNFVNQDQNDLKENVVVEQVTSSSKESKNSIRNNSIVNTNSTKNTKSSNTNQTFANANSGNTNSNQNITSTVAQTKTKNSKTNPTVPNTNNSTYYSPQKNATINSNEYNSVAENLIPKQTNKTINSNIPETSINKEQTRILINDTKNTVAQNNTIDSLKLIDKPQTKTDSLSIEEAIAQTEDLIKTEEKLKRWQVYANIAPVYYNTLGKGSHIDGQFVDNSKSGEVNTSYGVNVSYAINNKLKVRSGVNTLKLSYDTDNVILYESVNTGNSATLKNIDFSGNGNTISALSSQSLAAQQVNSLIGDANAAISQRIGYYEIPVELEYTLADNKFGLHVSGGLSTFILNDNQVYSEYDGYKTKIGEANNINDVSFSGNVGLGVDYKFSKKVKFNMQPTFKYQFNGYKNTSGDFRPYIIGIYTGFSYKF